MITIQQMVNREVMACMSSMVTVLASGFGNVAPAGQGADLTDLVEQAFELGSPIDDFAEAAIEAGWSSLKGVWRHKDAHQGSARDPKAQSYTDVQKLCEANDIDPYQREIYEFWAVTDWLAHRLSEAGERVDTDFAGMNVWGRTKHSSPRNPCRRA